MTAKPTDLCAKRAAGDARWSNLTAAAALAKALDDNTTLKRVSLAANSLARAGAECFARLLKDNTALAALDLSGLAAVDNALLAELAAAPARLQALALCACKAGPY